MMHWERMTDRRYVSIHLTLIPSTHPRREKCRKDHLTQSVWLLIGVPECLEQCVLERLIWVLDCLGLCVPTVWNNREWIFSGNDMWWNNVTVLQKGLERDHHSISEIHEVCVFFYLLCEYVPQIYDAWDMIHVNVLWLMTFANHISLRFKCLIPFEVTEASHLTAALLSLYILVLAYDSEMPMLLAWCSMDWSSVAHLLVATILD